MDMNYEMNKQCLFLTTEKSDLINCFVFRHDFRVIRVFRYIKYAFKIKLLVEYTSKSSHYE